MSAPRRESPALAASLDRCTTEVLECLAAGGMFGERAPGYTAAAYNALARKVDAGFSVPQTSITTAAARLLFGISETMRPRRAAVLGSYFGNTLVWLAGPLVARRAAEPFEWLIGCDVDAEACAGASANLELLSDPRIAIRCQDAREFLRQTTGEIELLLIDVDEAGARKRVYAELLALALPRLAPGALVLAHDRYEPVFESDFEPYLEIVRDRSLFDVSVGVPIDDAGFEISRHAGAIPS